MSRIRYLYTNRYPAATLTASSASSALPVTASQSPDRSYVFRSGTVAVAVTIDADLGAAYSLSAAAVANVRLFTGGVLEVYNRGTGATPGAATLLATLPAQDVSRRAAVVFFSAVSVRHVQFVFTNPTLVSSYVELGYAFLGAAFEPTINVRVPLDTDLIDPSVVAHSVDGQKATTERTRYEVGTHELFYAPAADADGFQAMQTAVGVRVPFFMVLDVTLGWTCWMAYFSTPIKRRFEEVNGRYTMSYGWEEAR